MKKFEVLLKEDTGKEVVEIIEAATANDARWIGKKKDNVYESVVLRRIKEDNIEKYTHGGFRPGSGRKKKEETTSTGFRINSEALAKCKEIYGRTLNAKVNAYIKRLAKLKRPLSN